MMLFHIQIPSPFLDASCPPFCVEILTPFHLCFPTIRNSAKHKTRARTLFGDINLGVDGRTRTGGMLNTSSGVPFKSAPFCAFVILLAETPSELGRGAYK